MGKSTTPRKITKKFVNTKPSDIKLPKSYSKFDRDLQDFKDRNKATMRTEPVKKVSKPDPKVTRQDVGMAPETTPKPKTTNVFKSVRAGKKVTNSKGEANKFRGPENKEARDREIKRRGGTVSASADLFDIVKGQLLDEGMSEEEIKDIMLTLTPDEIMKEMNQGPSTTSKKLW